MRNAKTNTEPTQGALGSLRRLDDADLVERLAAIACTSDEIARVIGCSAHTIERNFEEAFNRGAARARVSIRRRQFKAAMAGDVAMLIWLGKAWLGQQEDSEAADERRTDTTTGERI